MNGTSIQWCHDSVNPVMGCTGCELWPSRSKIIVILRELLPPLTLSTQEEVNGHLVQIFGDRSTSEVYRDREEIADNLAKKLDLSRYGREQVIDAIRRECKCYAGFLGSNRAGNKGHADNFDEPKMFPGRMAEAANWGEPTAKQIEDKSWLAGLRRLIFVSDMGDALSKGIPFEYLHQEIIESVNSPKGQRHTWLWLTKRPGHMAEFGKWLAERGIAWPDNLMAMTTVTSQATASRITALRQVPAKLKGLSVEPLFEKVNLDLQGINWVIAGGGSDILAEPFHVEWALDLQQQAKAAGAAFFLKQLGRHPFYQGKPLALNDEHGGDWSEWLTEWRVREFPAGFRASTGGSVREDGIAGGPAA